MQHRDYSELFKEQILDAIAQRQRLRIIGGNSKHFYGRQFQGKPLHVSKHNGIVDYQPTELMITVRCGTLLSELEAILAQQGQMLAFEAPHFNENTTIGGVVASGLSGPRRAYCGAVRDSVLGVRLLNGQGHCLRFGGQVMKNVAGFDAFRLQVGAMGTLGILLDISLKVLPKPESEITLVYAMDKTDALKTMLDLGRQHLPISALSFVDRMLYVRLFGYAETLDNIQKELGGERLSALIAERFWRSIRDQHHNFFQGSMALWRFSLAPASVLPDELGECLLDWGGALRWFRTELPDEDVFRYVKSHNAHICKFRSGEGSCFQPLETTLAHLHKRVKQAFDPHYIFNIGRLYAEW